MEKQVLIYGLGDQEEAVCSAVRNLGMRPRVVNPEETGEKIGYLCGKKGYRPQRKGAQTPVRSGSLMLMDGLSAEELDEMLDMLKQAGLGTGVLKATVTPTNCNWTLEALLEEVHQERETVQALIKLRKLLETVSMPDITNVKLISAMMQAQMLLSGTREVTVEEAENAYRTLKTVVG